MLLRAFLFILLLLLLNNNVHSQQKPDSSINKIQNSLSLQLKDTDGDGVNDDIDKCINEQGPASNFGCPVVNKEIIKTHPVAYKTIFFESGSSKFSQATIKGLNAILKILTDLPKSSVNLFGHSDNAGDSVFNRRLSNARAKAIKQYLIHAGIDKDRIFSDGYGSKYPIDTNETKEGRSRNRRVEIEVWPSVK